MELILPNKFEHLLDEPSDDKYWVQGYKKVTEWNTTRQKNEFDTIMNSLFCTDTSCLAIISNFDIVYSFVYHCEELKPENQELLTDMLSASLINLVKLADVKQEDSTELRNAFKMYILLLSHIFAKLKNQNLAKALLKALKAIKSALQNALKAVYPGGVPEDRLIELIIDITFFEIEKGQREEICEIMNCVAEHAKTEMWVGWRARAVNLLFGEQSAVIGPIASIVKHQPTLVCDLLKALSIAALEQNPANDTNGIKNVGAFIEKLSANLPREVLQNLPTLIGLFDCESYTLRNSIITAIGEIVCFLIRADQNEATEKDTATTYREQLLQGLQDRILDKSSFCRARVIDVFITLNKENLLPRHWFLPILNIATSRLHDCTVLVRKKACQLFECLIYQNKLLEGGMKVENKNLIDEQIDKTKIKLESLQRACDGQVDESLNNIEPEDLQMMYVKEQLTAKFLTDYADMIKLLEHGSKILKELLKSKNSSDITGAIDGLVACNLRGITTAYDAAASMLSLIWNRETTVRKTVLQAFSNIYLNLKLHNEEEVVANLLELIETLTTGQLTSLEDLFCELLQQQSVPPQILKKIWSVFKSSVSYPAACILRFTASSDPSFLNRRYDTFAARALQLAGDWKIFRETLVAFQKLEHQGEKTDQFIAQAIHKLFEFDGSGWFSVAEQLVRAASTICNQPLTVLKAFAVQSLKPLTDGKNSEIEVAKAIFVGTEIAMKTVVYGDKMALKYKKSMLTGGKQDEMDEISGGKAAQVENELQALRISQEKIVTTGILGKLTPLILSLSTRMDSIKTSILKKSVVLSLSKIMCINPAICEKYLPTLINIAQNGDCASMRSSALISLGDLVMRYPNLLEQYSEHLFARLKDPDTKVGKKALLVISHLVLNDMLKMKGLMGEVLQCYLEKDLKKVVCIFLQELHQKDANTIYNMIPDTISKLLQSSIPHPQFKRIADLLFSYIEKERQGENLVEKLCHKFLMSSKDEVLNIGYCLTRIPIGEKGMRRLLDNVSTWQNRLLEDGILAGYFNEILTKCKKNWKPESKILLDEFEAGLRGDEEVSRKRKVKA
ncbi:unnamed protein product [Blepharisma stoltei]|uniref:Condensin complex subunit 1 C-terminal domain-containing protein n=1 Tax=Blepharisma stoltei TaxID=1481888 RepID=A0AAU9JRR1_9CILI|nr:unnamed protein product [Blepharisma stoltei]